MRADRAPGVRRALRAGRRVAWWPAPLVAAGLLVLAGAAAAQSVRTAVVPDTATVGDVVRVAVRLTLAPGQALELPDTLVLGRDLENAARLRTTVDTLVAGGRRVTAVYAVTPWRPGRASLPELPVRVLADGATRTLSVALPPLHVSSVLPADTAGIEPKPLKGVVGRSWSLALLLGLLLLVLLIAAAVAYWLWRRRRARGALDGGLPVVPPRQRALALLERARAERLLERGELKAFYSLVAEALRRYAATLDRSWGEQLTTSELLPRVRRRDPTAGVELGEVLGEADLVKFARLRPTADRAEAAWQAARRWIEAYPPPVPEPAEERAA